MPEITVIIPVYNTKKYLENCVSSVQAQTENDLEIILVDDGSTDGSSVICDTLANGDNRIKVIHKTNGGVCSARNRGIKEAHGKYISFIDSDDWIDDEMYSSMLRTAKKSDCDVVMCDAVKEFENRHELFTQDIRPGFYSKNDLLNEYYPKLIMQNTLSYPPATSNWLLLVKSEVIKTNNLFYPDGIRISEDLLFGALVMYSANSFYYLKGKSYYHYFMGNTSSSTKKADPFLWKNYEALLFQLEENFACKNNFNFRIQISHAAIFFALNTINQTSYYSITNKEKRNIAASVSKSIYIKKAIKSIKYLVVPKKLKMEAKMLFSVITAELLMNYLILKNKRKIN